MPFPPSHHIGTGSPFSILKAILKAVNFIIDFEIDFKSSKFIYRSEIDF